MATETLVLKITPERAPGVYRSAELTGQSTFAELHDFIQEAFALDNDHMHAFFLTNRAWARKDVISCAPEAAYERDASEVTLGSLKLRRGKKFLYIFDFGDELRHEIEVVGRGVADPAVVYPLLVESVGRPPRQYGNDDDDDVTPLDDAELEPLAEELGVAIAAFDDEENSPNRTVEDFRRDAVLARRYSTSASAIEEHAGVFIDDWLLSLPFDLLDAGETEAAVALACEIGARYANVSDHAIEAPGARLQ